ncbi:protein phosphatase 2CA [Perilla frutescens var. hirtella]|uniref:protein-serine/threonine phosphatase n=1 Tax=Perilla frutescens var. hirtella TaxID=608512 RepID=A0AAD4J4V1_PERFH|nr:protein phosphatase 2CA [Perilla frutescens var. hirtella]KAH6805661.1 protein phosphatase 2CA [Perilla frutescens var. frutescens]KAH6827222.1 protein phosphatase 2CA [Perilla frutescens var. hirtella]
MAGIVETQTATSVQPISRSRSRMELHHRNFDISDSAVAPPLLNKKRRNVDAVLLQNSELLGAKRSKTDAHDCPKFGVTSVCGRRRDMEDAVAIRPSFCGRDSDVPGGLHFFGVFDGHGCSHVARRCKERMHEIVRDEYEHGGSSWEDTMARSFMKMDEEVAECSSGRASTSTCRCEMQTPQCDSVGSTAVVAVVSPDKIVVSNCGDSRAVLCRNGVAIPLSVDHKPDRPDELRRIEEAGGRVIYWDGARVLGVLAMSRAIGDSYLKPYVIPEPEVTVRERTAEDECLILASDGLWDVVSDQTACGVARMCLESRKAAAYEACSDASILLTRLALARRSTDNVSVVVVDLRKTS